MAARAVPLGHLTGRAVTGICAEGALGQTAKEGVSREEAQDVPVCLFKEYLVDVGQTNQFVDVCI